MPITRQKWSICPNCSTILRPEDNFCPHCGQENHDLRQPFQKLVVEILENLIPIGLTSINNKFWNSIKVIFTRPGQLTTDFLSGRRARYVLPTRLYILSSLAFFLVLGHRVSQQTDKKLEEVMKGTATIDEFIKADTLKKLGLSDIADVQIQYSLAPGQAAQVLTRLRQADSIRVDSLLRVAKIAPSAKSRVQLRTALALLPSQAPTPTIALGLLPREGKDDADIPFRSDSARQVFIRQVAVMNTRQLDSIVDHAGGKPGWLNRLILQKGSRLLNFDNVRSGTQVFTAILLKNLSAMMFVLMPFVAVLLWLFYARRKQ